MAENCHRSAEDEGIHSNAAAAQRTGAVSLRALLQCLVKRSRDRVHKVQFFNADAAANCQTRGHVIGIFKRVLANLTGLRNVEGAALPKLEFSPQVCTSKATPPSTISYS
jgi:hypothetical protein